VGIFFSSSDFVCALEIENEFISRAKTAIGIKKVLLILFLNFPKLCIYVLSNLYL